MKLVKIGTAFAVALALVLAATGAWAAAAEEEPAAAMEKEMVLDPTTGKMVTAPEYGGTITWPTKALAENTDPFLIGGGWAAHFISGVNEPLTFSDWGVSRDAFNFGFWDRPAEYSRGALAESWSMPDDTTLIFSIREGIAWDDKAPVNGRQLRCYDVEWNFHRYLGLGDFAEDGPSAHGFLLGVTVESVTATDQWTVEIKLTKPQLAVLESMLNNFWLALPREVVEEYGDMKDWRNVVGTGPLRLTDVVEGSSVTWQKNHNYWGYDEKFPDNRLPYIDEYRALLMPDMSTRLAALRTGKIDYMGNTGDVNIYSIDDLETLQRTNPEIEAWSVYGGPSGQFNFNWALSPVDDPNVRKALQMAVDRENISATYFRGYGDPTPGGLVSQNVAEGFYWPYEEWPEEVKKGYRYDPDAAEALLDEAGHPRGDDGYRFKVKLALHDRFDPTYAEIVMGYFDAIGVQSELVLQSNAESGARNSAKTAEWHLLSGTYMGFSGTFGIRWNLGTKTSHCRICFNKATDPRVDALYRSTGGGWHSQFPDADPIDIEEMKNIIREADEIMVREHWGLAKSTSPVYSVNHPWVKGYNGEWNMGRAERNTLFARLWIDQDLKEAMGY